MSRPIVLTVVLLLVMFAIGYCARQPDVEKAKSETVAAKTQTTVATVQKDETAAVAAVTEQANARITESSTRTARHVARIRAQQSAAPGAAGPADVPDGAFFDSVCDSPFYRRDPACDRHRRGP
jgi:Na+-transporting methylmalonyl-CoA/oxaloacetate decarboxylase gamma subunit